MWRKPVAEKLKSKLRGMLDTPVICEYDYTKIEDNVRVAGADVILIEITETGKFDFDYCLKLCARLRAHNRKLLLLCPEQDESCVSAVIKAERQGLIDDFIFYGASIDYVASKILA
jgi:hypothetical protein